MWPRRARGAVTLQSLPTNCENRCRILNMARRDQARWRLLRRFLLSYILVFFVPVLLSTRVYFTSVKRARDAAGDRVVTEIGRAMTLIDDRIAEMRTANALMAQSRVITRLFDLKPDLAGDRKSTRLNSSHYS